MSPATVRRQRILIVEDDVEMLRSYGRFFQDHRADEFSCTLATDGEQALDVLRREHIDIIVLDWSLPGISGVALAKVLRAHSKMHYLGILMVTARGTAAETVAALESGADDHLAKPFEWSVLLARLRSLARRRSLTFDRSAAKRFPGLELDLDADRLRVNGVPVRLTPKEMELLKIFVARPDILHAQSYLWSAIWGYHADGWERTLIVTLSSLRKKLGRKWGACLKTHVRRGYIFEPTP